jgi:hypothetical protein
MKMTTYSCLKKSKSAIRILEFGILLEVLTSASYILHTALHSEPYLVNVEDLTVYMLA